MNIRLFKKIHLNINKLVQLIIENENKGNKDKEKIAIDETIDYIVKSTIKKSKIKSFE